MADSVGDTKLKVRAPQQACLVEDLDRLCSWSLPRRLLSWPAHPQPENRKGPAQLSGALACELRPEPLHAPSSVPVFPRGSEAQLTGGTPPRPPSPVGGQDASGTLPQAPKAGQCSGCTEKKRVYPKPGFIKHPFIRRGIGLAGKQTYSVCE